MSSKITYRQQFTRCGKQRCRKCKEGAGHGPYWYAYWSVNGRTVSKYIGKHPPENVEIETNNNKSQRRNVPTVKTAALSHPYIKHQVQEDSLVKTPLAANNSSIFMFERTTDDQPSLRIYVLGQFRIEHRNDNDWQAITSRMWQRRRARALLGCLLSNAGRRLGREQAMEAIWPDLDIETAANRLNGAVHEVRQILEPGITKPATSQLLRLEHDVLQLAGASQIWVDADIFEGLLNKAHVTSDPLQAEQILEEASRLYGGDYLLEELYSEWAATRRESLRRGWIGLLLNLAELRASRGALASAIEPLDRLLATDPTHETAVRRLMLLLTQLDRRGEALHLYQRLANILKRENASEPLPETYELYEALRQGYMYTPHPITSQATSSEETATSIDFEIQSTPPTPLSAPMMNQRSIQSFPRPILQLGRQNQSPLVGRESELAILRQYLLTTENASLEETQNGNFDGEGQSAKRSAVDFQGKQKISHFLLLMGESGLGKTRLAEELSLEANARGWSVAWTHAYEQESAIPYRPWTDLLRALLQDISPELLQSIVEAPFISLANDTANSMQYAQGSNSKLARLSALLPELTAYDPLTPLQNGSTSPLPPEQERLHLWEATLALLSTLSKTTPLLLVLDDLHWTDDSSLELLAYLVRHLQDERILIVGTCRDVELNTNSNLHTLINDLRREQIISSFSIQSLTQDQIGSLIAYLPNEIVQSIQIHAGGNPFFAEELARVSENLLLSPANPAAGITFTPQFNAPGEDFPVGINRVVALPETIAAVLERRLSKLSSDCQSLLGKAAILGDSFEFKQLLFMAGDQGRNEDTILDLIEEALRAGLLTEEGTGTRINYHFWHPLIVSHLYERQSAARQAQMHRRAAKALLHLHHGHEAEVASAVTYHLSKGGSDSREIIHYAEIAGNRAFSLPAYSEAEHYYRKAIEALTGGNISTSTMSEVDSLHLAYLLEQVAECNMVKGDYAEARKLYENVLNLRNLHQINTHTSIPAQIDSTKAQQELQRETQLQALIWREIGRTWEETGDYTHARQCYTYGKQVMLEAGVTSGSAWACLHLQQGNISWKEGNYDDARTYAQEALEMLAHVIEEQHAKGAGPKDTSASNHPPSNTELQTRIARALVGDPLEVGRCHEILGITLASTGQYTEGLKHLETACSIFEQHGLVTALTQVYGNLGAIYVFKAENAVARTYFQRALELAERNSDFPDMAFVIGNLADVAARSGDLREAEAWFKRSIMLAERINDREQLCWSHVALASALQDQGNMRGALEHIRRALALGRAMQSTRGLGFALVALGDWRVTQAMTISNVVVINLKEQTIIQDPACYRLVLSACAALERALALEGLDAEVMTEGHLSLAVANFLSDKLDIARQKALQTLEQARVRELTRIYGRSQRLLGRIFAAQDQPEQADDYFEQAIEVFNRYEMRLDYARTLHSFGVILLRRNQSGNESYQRGLAYLHQARDIFSACGAMIDLDWVERIIANLEKQHAEAQ
jgi:predicted ATPase/DNA-binding SARP family transcriptional activator/Tfp pilus assembly protein PilF